MAEDTVFTKIIKGDLPSCKIYEDDRTMAFMDIAPIQPGMVVVVTKNQIDNIEDLPDEDYQALWFAVKKIIHQLRVVFPDKKKIGIQVEGFDVPHAHVKLFPVNSGYEFRAEHDSAQETDLAKLKSLAQRLRIDE